MAIPLTETFIKTTQPLRAPTRQARRSKPRVNGSTPLTSMLQHVRRPTVDDSVGNFPKSEGNQASRGASEQSSLRMRTY